MRAASDPRDRVAHGDNSGLALGPTGHERDSGGGVLYVVGMFVCTAVIHVPMNDALAAVDPASTEAASLWARYLTDWTLWNHVRTISSTLACALFIWGIAAR